MRLIVYIDVLIFTNIIINYCILSVTQKFLHIITNEARLISGAVIGSLFSLTAFFDKLNPMLSILLKLTCAIVMCLIAFKNNGIKYHIRNIISVFASSLIFCSVMIAFFQIVKPSGMAIINDNIYFQIDPIILIALSIITYFIIIIVQKIVKTNFDNTLVNLVITLDNVDFSCIGKIDTGCTVVEPFSGAPVIITERSVFNNIKFDNPRIIPYKGLNSQGLLYGIKANKIQIDGKVVPTETYIAITDDRIDPQFKAIINHKIKR